ncbi:MAG: hypothetical protein JXA68_04970, partial [Ignavibacteriales bacterium]|nr:hypothetical protein [Ignavibacteriales bacterium]
MKVLLTPYRILKENRSQNTENRNSNSCVKLFHLCYLCAIAFVLFTTSIYPQVQKLHVPINIQDAYGTGTRDLSGNPGIFYWQNSADYSIN